MIAKNNPFMLPYSRVFRWKGLIGNNNGFCEFEDIKYSVRAMAHLFMWTYRKAGVRSYGDIIANICHNNSNSLYAFYLHYIERTLQVNADDKPKCVYDFARLLVRIAYYESCFVLDLKYTIYLIHHFKIKIYE